MRSIALFPCSCTNGATIIGELINSLHLSVYTDEMLISEVSEQFGISVEALNKVIFGRLPALHRYKLKKEKYINCLKCSLNALLRRSPNGQLHYGLHTALLDSQIDLVLKVLIFDDEKRRVKRAMQQEGFSEKLAEDYIQRHDEKVSGWTNFLFQKQAYDQSLYDVVLPLNNKNPTDITLEVIEYFNNMASWQTPFQANAALPVLEKYMSMGEQIGAY